MTSPTAPRLEERRAPEFTAELEERARAWMPEWGFADSERDFGRALLEIAARFSSEVAERLDRAGEKMRRGFLDWLAERGEAARPSRMPVVFKLADTAREALLAEAPVRMQADADGTPVVFETEHDVRIIPGRVGVVVAVDAGNDAFYLPAPGLSDLEPPEPLPTEWQLKSFASAKTKKLQLDPETGLAEEMLIEAGGNQYRITKADNEIVTIDPALDSDLDEGTPVRKVESFAPFETGSRNRQAHALYLGHMELLNIEAEATIEVTGASTLVTGIEWQYWGKTETSEEPDWIALPVIAQKPNAVVLQKAKGPVEPRLIGGVNSRWTRAYARKVDGTTPLLRVDALELMINCEPLPPCPAGSALIKPSTAAEAMANTTPLVLDNIFFPLGKEPRQFDAFYLGSEEAFSKEAANVQLCFEMADRTFSALAAVRDGTFANSVLAGIAKDRSLHLLSFNPGTGSIGNFRDRDPLQPPRPGYFGSAAEGPTIALDAQPAWRLPVWSEQDSWFSSGFLAATAAGDAIWIWHENSLSATSSGWVDFGKLPTTDPAGAVVDGLVYLAGAPGMLAALLDGELFKRNWQPNPLEWSRVTTQDGGTEIKLRSIVPVLIEDAFGRLVTSSADGMIGVDEQDKLYRVATTGNCTPLLPAFDFDSAVRPVAIKTGVAVKVAAVTKSDPPKLIAHDGAVTTVQEQLEPDTEVLAALDAVLIGGKFHVLATVRDGAGGSLATWAPFETGSAASVFLSPVGPSGGHVEGAALAVGKYVVIAGARADILVSEFDPSLRLVKSANVEIGVVLPDSIPALSVGDLIVRSNTGQPVDREITKAGLTKDGEVFYQIDSAFPAGASGLDAYDLLPVLTGTFADPKLTLDSSDDATDEGDWLLIDGEFFEVLSIATNNNDRIATLDTPNGGGTTPLNGNTDYARPIKTNGRVAPFMELNTSTGGSGDWDASLLDRIRLIFPGETPEEQSAKAFDVDINNKPVVVVLGAEFQSALANPTDFLVDAAFGEWRRDAGDTSTNPELSWEYWNGKGWWKLLVTRDDTQHFKTTGVVRFEVPSDIASSDWSGKTNFWIRARLIGGDYGREEIKVKIKNLGGGDSEQTIERSTKGIRPPAVVRLHVSYQLCKGVRPDYVQAQDSGTIRDQSDANRTAGAIVEAFVPLAHMLGRLLKATAPTEPISQCPPECGCSKQHGAGSSMQTAPGTESPPAVVPATGRSIFVGLNATPSEAPINLLLLVEKEQGHGAFAPMSIEALVADRFVPIVAEDKTRALGESGLLSMNFADPPTRSELFGNENLTWLRFSPRSVEGEDWIPSLRGVYLNAAWASATETLTRELVGSSDGEPNLTLNLARPPVLHKSLELRVKEPLGEEEREELRKDDDKRVLSDIDGLPGDWVLWKQVIDPDDEPADARVYSLDDANGEIRFGDGRRGKIPPIARDSIVAFSYQRTEPPVPGSETVPGNTISARTALNLVSPVETVESVIAADQAAGGAPPESDERVLRFGFARIRHRERAVSVSDLEDLALQSSPDIVQARAIVRRGYIRLVVVMKGKDPVPNAAQVRELRRLLLDASPMSLSAPNSLRIAGPAIRKLRVDLTLRIRTLDDAGAVGRWVKDSLIRFFDTATGGNEKDGWGLGVNPNDSDIAFALIDAPHLEGIANVELIEITDDRTPRPWPKAIAQNEIVMLAGDPVRIEFETAEVMV